MSTLTVCALLFSLSLPSAYFGPRSAYDTASRDRFTTVPIEALFDAALAHVAQALSVAAPSSSSSSRMHSSSSSSLALSSSFWAAAVSAPRALNLASPPSSSSVSASASATKVSLPAPAHPSNHQHQHHRHPTGHEHNHDDEVVATAALLRLWAAAPFAAAGSLDHLFSEQEAEEVCRDAISHRRACVVARARGQTVPPPPHIVTQHAMARAHVHSLHSFDRGGGGVEEGTSTSVSTSTSASTSEGQSKGHDDADHHHALAVAAAEANALCEREWRAADRAARMLAGAFDFSRLLLLQNGFNIEVCICVCCNEIFPCLV